MTQKALEASKEALRKTLVGLTENIEAKKTQYRHLFRECARQLHDQEITERDALKKVQDFYNETLVPLEMYKENVKEALFHLEG